MTRKQIDALLKALEAMISGGYKGSIAGIMSNAQLAQAIKAIEIGDIDKLMQAVGVRPGSFTDFNESVRGAYLESGAFFIGADVPKRFGAIFDISNPRAEAWLKQRSSQMITRITQSQREAIQLILRDGMKLGRNPRSVGLDIIGRMGKGGIRTGGVIGLNGPQAELVRQMRNALSGADVVIFHADDGRLFTKFWIGDDGKLKSVYTRRDHRFDSVIRKAIDSGKPLPSATVDRLTSRYSDRLKELRGATIGRTEALASLNAAADESLQQIIQEGLAPPDAVKRIWRHSYGKDERPGHLAMSGQERGPDEPFANPYTGALLQRPGDGPASEVINCRCYVEHKIDFVKVEQARAY